MRNKVLFPFILSQLRSNLWDQNMVPEAPAYYSDTFVVVLNNELKNIDISTICKSKHNEWGIYNFNTINIFQIHTSVYNRLQDFLHFRLTSPG
jgi:hypothetical protein